MNPQQKISKTRRSFRRPIIVSYMFVIPLIALIAVLTDLGFAVSPKKPIQTSIFNNAEPEPIPMLNFSNLNKDWFQAKITHKKGMFNPVFLPFEYEYNSGVYDVKQPLTFPSLLSFKFDFVPDNFSARHPGFIYRKAPVWNVMSDEVEKIARYVIYWEATHAIGGKIIQSEEGYTGQMLAWDKTGKLILRQNYNKPVPYFTLMGNMVRTWMDFRGQPVSKELYKELTLPMTNDMECVRLYGKSYDVEWRTEDEWQIYENILKKDPDFAEVRHWYSNQKSWATGLHDELNIETGKVLQSHLVIPALNEFEYAKCSDKTILDAFYKALSRAEQICSNHCTVLSVKLEIQGSKLTVKELDRYLAIVEKNPCSWNLIEKLAWEYRNKFCYEKSMPLYLSAVNSGYLTRSGAFHVEWSVLAKDYYDLGYMNEAIFCAMNALFVDNKQIESLVNWVLAQALREKKHFKRAADIFTQYAESNKDLHLVCAYLCAHEYGDLSLLNGLKEKRFDEEKIKLLDQVKATLVKEGYSKAIFKLQEFFPKYDDCYKDKGKMIFSYLQKDIILSDFCILSNNFDKAKELAVRASRYAPRSRHVAYLLENSIKDDLVSLARYSQVGLFICKNDPTWQSIYYRTSKYLVNENQDEVMKLYNNLKKEIEGVSEQKEHSFWFSLFPFKVEYITMYLIKKGDKSIRDEILNFYLRYKNNKFNSITISQWMHTRAFFFQLLTLIPERERAYWIEQLDLNNN